MTIEQYRQICKAITALGIERAEKGDLCDVAQITLRQAVRAARDMSDEYDTALCDILSIVTNCEPVGAQVAQAVDVALCIRHDWHRDPRHCAATRID